MICVLLFLFVVFLGGRNRGAHLVGGEIAATKKALVSSQEETKAQTSAVPLSLAHGAHFRHQPSFLSESRLFGNGEETRFHLSPKGLSENTQGPVTSPCSALPRSNRQLSEASAGRFFPVIVSALFTVAIHHTGANRICQAKFFLTGEIFIRCRWSCTRRERFSSCCSVVGRETAPALGRSAFLRLRVCWFPQAGEVTKNAFASC